MQPGSRAASARASRPANLRPRTSPRAHWPKFLPYNRSLFMTMASELVSRLNDVGEATSTIANRKVAAIRLRLDAPASAYFFNLETGLRVDLLFDFPIPAARLAEHATRTKTRSHMFDIASEPDL